MATESTAQLLEKIRSHLLELAGSKPATPSTTSFPTLDEIVANSGTGPFRCQKCRASLLRGPNSQICVACGTEREGVASSFQISFASTLAYELLMNSFQPQDSEVATGKGTQHAEASNLQTQQTETVDGLIACDILNLVLKWPGDETQPKEQASVLQTANANATHGMDFDLEDFFVQSKSHNVAGLPKEVFTSTHHIEDVKWHAPADSMPQVSLSEINIDLFDAQQGRGTRTHFESTNSTLDNSESKNQNVLASTDLIEDVKCYASADSMPQVNLSESNMDLFSTQPGWQTQTHIKDDDIFGDLKSANSESESNNQVFTSTHHIEEYHAPADPLPQINLGETNIDLFGSQTGRQLTHTGDEDPFGDFISTNSILDNSGLEDEVVTSAHHIGDVKWHPLVDSMPQVTLNESSVNVFNLDPGRQQTETHTRDDDTFGDFESADSMHSNFESKNLDGSAASLNDYPFNLMEETKASDRNRISHSAFHGQDLLVNPGNNREHVTPMEGNWFQDDPWSAIITEEKIIESSNNLKESADLQPDWPETNILADNQDPFAGYIWEQCDTSHFNESATENSRNYTSGENGGAEHNVLFTTDPAFQALELDKETTSINGILTEINRFNRVESREANHQAKPMSDSLEMEDILVAMPKGSSNDDSGPLIKSLLSEMHDLSFMLADYLVIPDRDGKHSLCL